MTAAKIREVEWRRADERVVRQTRVEFWCPGCADRHDIVVAQENTGGPLWEFNGDTANPTVSPSILVRSGYHGQERVCHSFIRDGQWQFLNDCTHALAGQTVPMPEVPEAL